MEAAIFIPTALVAIAAALVVLFHRNPVIGALFLVANLLCIAILFLLLGAPFLSAIQVIVYAGAIMVLILFVIMLLNLRREATGVREGGAGQKVLGFLTAAAFLAIVAKTLLAIPGGSPRLPRSFGTAEYIGRSLFGTYFYPFEVISLILLVAMVGAVVLAKKKL